MARPSKLHMHNGQWRARINGREIYFGHDERKARHSFYKALMESHRSEDDGGAPATIAGAVLQWLELHPSESQKRKLRAFCEFGRERYLAEVGRDLLTRYVVYLRKQTYQPGGPNNGGKNKPKPRGYSPETVINYTTAARSVLLFAQEQGWLEVCPSMPDLPRAPVKDRDIPLSKIDAALEHVHDNARRIFRFCAETGCRPGEARSLKWEHVRRDLGVVILPDHKTAKETGEPRVFGITPGAAEVLDELTAGEGHVFVNRDGNPYTSGGLRAILRRHGIRPNQLRHTWAQAATDSGMAEDVIAAQLGHADTRTTKRYKRIRAARLAAVASNFRLVRTAG